MLLKWSLYFSSNAFRIACLVQPRSRLLPTANRWRMKYPIELCLISSFLHFRQCEIRCKQNVWKIWSILWENTWISATYFRCYFSLSFSNTCIPHNSLIPSPSTAHAQLHDRSLPDRRFPTSFQFFFFFFLIAWDYVVITISHKWILNTINPREM